MRTGAKGARNCRWRWRSLLTMGTAQCGYRRWRSHIGKFADDFFHTLSRVAELAGGRNVERRNFRLNVVAVEGKLIRDVE